MSRAKVQPNRSPRSRWRSLQMIPRSLCWLGVGLALGLTSCSDSSTSTAENSSAASPLASPLTLPSTTPTPAAAFTPTPAALNKPELTRALEAGLRTELAKQLSGTAIQAIACPPLSQVEVGKVFDCEVAIAEGKFPVAITMTNPDGGLQMKTKQLVDLVKVEALLQQNIKEKDGIDYKVNCGRKVLLVQPTEQTIDCQLTDQTGTTKSATVTIKDETNIKAKWEK